MLLHPGNDCGRDRALILPLIAWAVSIGLVLGMVLWASKVFAADVHSMERDGTSIHLTDAKCTDARTAMLMPRMVPPDYFDKFRAIESVWRMRDGSSASFNGCWLELSAQEAGTDEPMLILIFEDGETYQLALSEFLRPRNSRMRRTFGPHPELLNGQSLTERPTLQTLLKRVRLDDEVTSPRRYAHRGTIELDQPDKSGVLSLLESSSPSAIIRRRLRSRT